MLGCKSLKVSLGSRGYAFLFSCALLLCGPGSVTVIAQTALGDLAGVVTDSSGGVLPGVTVTITNEGTGAVRTAISDDAGNYRVDGLLVGRYRVEAELAGFKRFARGVIPISPAQLRRVDVVLEVGEITEVVEVRGIIPVIQSESPTLTTGIPRVGYAEKPIANASRQGYTFDPLTWAPGSASGDAIYSFAGNRPSMQQTNIEGLQHNMFRVLPPTSAVSEVTVVMSNAPAEYARPVTMDGHFKSGTNRLSGEVMIDFVNPCTDAKSTPFSNPTSRPCPTQWRNFFSASGPVVIPGVYDGRNKTFFFVTVNKSPATVLSVPVTLTLPTLAMQRGDFSKYPKTINDPVTQKPFPGNILPSERISGFAKAVIADLYGSRYNYVGNPDTFANNAEVIGGRVLKEHKYMLKLDHNWGNRDILSGSYLFTQRSDAIDMSLSGGLTPLQTYRGLFHPARTLSLVHTHTFSPSVVNQLRAGFTHYSISFDQLASLDVQDRVRGADVAKRWGIQGIPSSDFTGSPLFTITNWSRIISNNEQAQNDTRYQVYNNLSIHLGRHFFKLGVSVAKLEGESTATGAYFGNFSFNGRFTGEPWADFLLGLPQSAVRFIPRKNILSHQWELGIFAQDDFKMSRNLTLFYGLRWDKYTIPYDANGLYYNFDPRTFSVVVPDQFARDRVNPAWPSSTFPIRTAAEVGFPGRLFRGSSRTAPRFGFAYRLFNSEETVLRGGYGVFTGARLGQLQTLGPFTVTESFSNELSPESPTGALFAFPQPFPSGFRTVGVQSLRGFNVDIRDPYSQNWNLTLERRLFRNWGGQITYRGVKTTQMLWTRDLNAVPVSADPFKQSNRPFPTLGAISFTDNGANDYYHALVLRLTQPWDNGFYLDAAYSYQRSQSEAPGDPFELSQTAASVEYDFDRVRDQGRNAAFPTHDFIANFVVDLPIGSGKPFGSNWRKDYGLGGSVLDALGGNWSLSGAFSWRSGKFFTPLLQGVDPGNIGKFSGRRPNLVPGCDPTGGQNLHGQWFDPKCFTAPPAGRLGNVEVNSLEGPGAWVLNLNPFKDFPLSFIREGTRLRFGANIYNILNHPTYGKPIANLNSPSAGKITAIDNARAVSHEFRGQRQFIFTARLIF